MAWNSALIYDMIFTQPAVYEFGLLAPPEAAAQLGHYPELGKLAARTIPHATLVEFPGLGHAPQIQDPETFHAALLAGLSELRKI